MKIELTEGYSMEIREGSAALLHGGREVRTAVMAPGENGLKAARRMLKDKTLTGMGRLAVLRLVCDSALLKNGSGFIAW